MPEDSTNERLIAALEQRLAVRQGQVEIYKAALETIAGRWSRDPGDAVSVAREALKLGAGRG